MTRPVLAATLGKSTNLSHARKSTCNLSIYSYSVGVNLSYFLAINTMGAETFQAPVKWYLDFLLP